MAFDTLSISKELRAAGFSDEQADVLATQMAARPDDLVTRQDLALAVAELERKIDLIDAKIDQVDQKVDGTARDLLLKLGGVMVVGFSLTLTAVGILVVVLAG